ncbi:MAG: LytTR family DNA-binding domain-containing protein [Bacillota bacterium]|nr:LytTR family DNA-binding domain-containing protein [Bacillota bacterium]
MKITIENISAGTEPEIVIRCNQLDENLLQLVYSINSAVKKLVGYENQQMYLIESKDVFYFEAVDNKVFIYCREKVLESKMKLYEIEKEYEKSDFFRASKSIILNLSKIESINPTLSGRFEALLQNSEKIVISRQYFPVLRRKLGL